MDLRMVRLLFLRNGYQPGASECFKGLASRGEIAAFGEYDFLAKENADPDFNVRGPEIRGLARQIKPNLVLWQHVGTTPITRGFLEEFRNATPGARVAYQELDAWGGRAKQLTQGMRLLCGVCDDLILCGGSYFEDQFSPWLSEKVRVHWFGHTVDERWETAGDMPGLDVPRKYDVVMIGNNSLPRFRWLRHMPRLCLPGSVARYWAVLAVSRAFGNRAAIYGRGWEGVPRWQGPRPYDAQTFVQREGWLSAMWNNYDKVPFYSSDRPIIALLSGVPHVTNYQPGYELLFGPNGQNLFWAHEVPELVDTVRFLLSRPRDELLEVGRRGREFARRHLWAGTAYRNLVTRLVEND